MADVNQTQAERDYARSQGFADYQPPARKPRKSRGFFQRIGDTIRKTRRRQSRNY